MYYHWVTHNIVEHVRERQIVLQKEAARQRLLQQITRQTEQFLLVRKAVQFTGNLLIASGTWLKQRAALDQPYSNVQTMADRFSRVSQ